MIADGPFRTPREFAGVLGKAQHPLFGTRDPNATTFDAGALRLPDGLAGDRAAHRDGVLRDLEGASRLADSGAVKALGAHQGRGLDVLTSRKTQRALALGCEPDRLRERYGRTT